MYICIIFANVHFIRYHHAVLMPSRDITITSSFLLGKTRWIKILLQHGTFLSREHYRTKNRYILSAWLAVCQSLQLCGNVHRVSQKNDPWLRQMLTDFQKFFTIGLSSDCVMNWSLKIPSHLKLDDSRVKLLKPCKTLVFKNWSNCTLIITSVAACSSLAYKQDYCIFRHLNRFGYIYTQ